MDTGNSAAHHHFARAVLALGSFGTGLQRTRFSAAFSCSERVTALLAGNEGNQVRAGHQPANGAATRHQHPATLLARADEVQAPTSITSQQAVGSALSKHGLHGSGDIALAGGSDIAAAARAAEIFRSDIRLVMAKSSELRCAQFRNAALSELF
jgi:hypothetical protein